MVERDSGFLTGWQDQYGTRQSLLGKIVIEYADGTRETIVTNDSGNVMTGDRSLLTAFRMERNMMPGKR